MKLLLKFVFVAALVVILGIAALITALLYINPNDYKEVIINTVTKEIGRDININGDIHLTHYPWLGVNITDVSIGNAKGFDAPPLLEANTVNARVKLLPLLRKKVEMDTFVLHDAKINLIKNKQGVTNWDGLVKAKTEKSKSPLPFSALVLGGIDIKNAHILWQDKQQGIQYEINHADIRTSELKFNSPISFSANLSLTASKPELSTDIKLNGSVIYADQGNQLLLKPMLLQADIKGKRIPNGVAFVKLRSEVDVALNKKTAQINLSQLSVFGTALTGKLKVSKLFSAKPEIAGNIDIGAFNLRQFMKALNKPLPITSDKKVLNKVAITTSFFATPSSLVLKELTTKLDETTLQGKINLKQISPLAIAFDLGMDKLNIDRYLPAKEAKKLTPETAAVATVTNLPIDMLRTINIKGNITADQLTASNTTLDNVKIGLHAKEGDINLAPAKANFYHGTYDGKIHLTVNDKLPKLTMQTKLNGVQIESLLKDIAGSTNVKGKADIKLTVSASGAEVNTLRKNLAGKGEILIENGSLIGVDVRNVFDQIELMIETKNVGIPDAGEITKFEKLTATLNIHNGIIKNHDLLMLGSGFNVTGTGTVLNLQNETWDYTLIAKTDTTRLRQGEQTFNLGGYEVPIKCTGKIIHKYCRPEIKEIATTIIQKTVVDKLFDDVMGLKKKDNTAPDSKTTNKPNATENIQEKVIEGIFDKLF